MFADGPCTSACRQRWLENAGRTQGSCEEEFARPSVLPNGNPTGTTKGVLAYRTADSPFSWVTTKVNFHVAKSPLFPGISMPYHYQMAGMGRGLHSGVKPQRQLSWEQRGRMHSSTSAAGGLLFQARAQWKVWAVFSGANNDYTHRAGVTHSQGSKPDPLKAAGNLKVTPISIN